MAINGTIAYKGYIGSIELQEDNTYYGKVLGIEALVAYEGDTAEALIEDFHGAVDDYLAVCEAEGIEPEVPQNTGIIDDFAAWLKSQTIGVDSKNSTILVAVPEGNDLVWRDAIEVFKTLLTKAAS